MTTKLAPKAWWRKSHSAQLGQILLGGLALGVLGRWMQVTAPPLPVMARPPGISNSATSTNTPTAVRIEGASPSGRD
jgi:hypothetical protein